MPTPEELGRRLVEEMRRPLEHHDAETAADVLRWGADALDDEQLWLAVIAAVDEAHDDHEYWLLGDGLVDESVRTRPALAQRWRESRATHPKVAEVYRVMQDPAMSHPDHKGWGE